MADKAKQPDPSKIGKHQQQLLQQLPGVDRLLTQARKQPGNEAVPKTVLVRAIRDTLARQRDLILNPIDKNNPISIAESDLMQQVACAAKDLQAFNLKRVINATGVVIHTNLGRSCLSNAAMDHVRAVARHYSNLEFDLACGRRGSRYSAIEELLCEQSGAEAALVVNNNAGAVLLCLDTLARKQEVILSRGEMVEIGGSFRIPDVMAKSGAILKEVGTTNRTHLKDYESAIGTQTGLLLKVHTSNYQIMGFTAEVALADLVILGSKFNLPVMEDLGSGNFINFSQPGLNAEPTVQHAVASGADVVTFSGDKLLGGPQAGLIVGRKKVVDQIKSNPLTRALRIDKLTLAALEATLHLYRDTPQAIAEIPTLRMLTAQYPEIKQRAHRIKKGLDALKHKRLGTTLCDMSSRAGGGSLPLLELPSCCVGISVDDLSANAVEKALRNQQPAVLGRIEDDLYILDPRTLDAEEVQIIVAAFDRLLTLTPSGEMRDTPH